MAIHVIRGKYPHVGWVDLEQKGILTEVAIMKNGDDGLYFIKLNSLDAIDRQRLFRIITNRNAHMYELWDLMSNMTLGNGANALEYFHQSVKILTPSGQTMNPQLGRIATPAATGVVQPHQMPVQQQAPVQQMVAEQAPQAPASTTKTRTVTRKKTTTEE